MQSSSDKDDYHEYLVTHIYVKCESENIEHSRFARKL